MDSNKRENMEQIPREDDPQGGTGKVVSEQGGIEGQRKEVNVESYTKVAEIGQMLKDVEFPLSKNEIITHIKQQHSKSANRETILEKLENMQDREYINVSDITTSAGLVY